jgi:hypothetical protein
VQPIHRTLQAAVSGVAPDDECFQDFHKGGELVSNVTKGVVLTEAMNYVHRTEVEMRHMNDEIQRLNSRAQSLEKLVLAKHHCPKHEGISTQPSNGMQFHKFCSSR